MDDVPTSTWDGEGEQPVEVVVMTLNFSSDGLGVAANVLQGAY